MTLRIHMTIEPRGNYMETHTIGILEVYNRGPVFDRHGKWWDQYDWKLSYVDQHNGEYVRCQGHGVRHRRQDGAWTLIHRVLEDWLSDEREQEGDT